MSPPPAASKKKDNSSGGTDEKKKQAASKTVKLSPDQRYYAVDADKLTALQEEKPWMKSAKYFQSVAVSPSAVTKMMMHCASGVEKELPRVAIPLKVQRTMMIYLALT